MAIIKCTQLHGLADKSDYTCEFLFPPLLSLYDSRLTKRKTGLPTSSCGPSEHPHLNFLLCDLTLCSPCSIEANVVVIASCIPTLQPLLEIILGKRALGSYSQGKSDQYKNSSNFPSTFHRSKQSKTHDDLGFTNIDNQESQESILPTDDHGKKSHPLGHIHRKDDVTVEYEPSTPKAGPGYTPW